MDRALVGGCPLTPGQLAVLRCLARGMTRKQTAAELGITVSAVWHHISRACARLGVTARSDAAILLCQREGWLTVELPHEAPLEEVERAYVASFMELLRRSPTARQRLLDGIIRGA
jgi:DNA-binding CsgD family transcriptional regulator